METVAIWVGPMQWFMLRWWHDYYWPFLDPWDSDELELEEQFMN